MKKYIFRIILSLIILVIFFSFFEAVGGSEEATVDWSITFGGERYDTVLQLINTSDNGYALSGFTGSFDSKNHDCWLVKVDQNGTVMWNKYYGGDGDDGAYSLIETGDEGFTLVGFSTTVDGDYNVILIKTKLDGDILWYKAYGGFGEDRGTSLVRTTDDGYCIAGFTCEADSTYNFLLIKTDELGNETWNKTYGGSLTEKAWSLTQTNDGGYAIAGYTTSFGSGGQDFWLIKTDQNGTMEWNRTYGGKDDDVARSLIQTSDGGFALAGYTTSYGSGGYDFWIVKTDQNGTMEWNRTYGGIEDDVGRSLVQTEDGGYAIAGYAEIGFYYDFSLLKTNSNGYLQWSENYSRISDAFALSLMQAKDKGFVMGGYTQVNHTNSLLFMVKTNESTDDIWNLYPIANAGSDVTTNKSDVILFDASESYDPDGSIDIYRWDFDGDGIFDWESNTTELVNYTYEKGGTYNALLQVTDNNGSSSTDMRKIVVLSTEESINQVRLSEQIWVIILGIMIIISALILLVLNVKNIKLPRFHGLKFFHFTLKFNKWIKYLIICFLFLVGIKIILSFLFDTPFIYDDEPAYAVIAKNIFFGNIIITGETPFTHPYPAGYSYLLAPTYFLGNNMDLAFHGMLIVNCVLSSLIIFPVFFIMCKFISEKYSLLTSILVATLPVVNAHNFLLMSENVFYPLFLFSCLLTIKVFTYEKWDWKFIFLCLLLGINIGLLIFIKAIGIAMLGALLCLFLCILIKKRKISSLKYGIIFLPFLPILGYLIYKGGEASLGYSVSLYITNMFSIFSDLPNLTRFITVLANEISYFVTMSYIFFMVFTVFLFIYWKNVKQKEKNSLFVLSVYGLFSIFFLIFLTALHIYLTPYNIYSRYVSPGLPIVFMLGVVGINLFNRVKNQKVHFQISLIFILLSLFFVSVFPLDGIKIANNLDLVWVIYSINTMIFGISVFNLFRILLTCLVVTIIIVIFLKWFRKKNICFTKKITKSLQNLLVVFLIISLLIFIPSFNFAIGQNKSVLERGYNYPARWFMHNDPDAYIIMEDDYSAFSGGGMYSGHYDVTFDDMFFWLPNGHVEAINRYNLSRLVLSVELSGDYILSTHDLTQYYTLVEDFYMNLPVNPMKSQDKVDWYIYKINI